MEILPIKIRVSTKDDEAIILSSWKQSLFNCGVYEGFPKPVFFRHQGKFCDYMLNKHGASVACNPICEQQVFGWIVCQGSVVHYVYVKRRFRRQGVASRLISSSVGGNGKNRLVVTSWNHVCEKNESGWELVYKPSLLRKGKIDESN
jgi:GNAT superfamily N-acetyltransferase